MVDPASPLEVDLAVAEAAAAVRPDGLLIVYFAGHGLIERDGQTLYLGLVNTDRSRVHSTAVPYEWIHNTVRRSGTDRRLVILDCCYAGRADMAPMDAAESLAQSARIETACLLAAAAATEAAQAPPGAQYTAFPGELIKVITEALRGGPLLLVVGTIWQAVRERLAPHYPAPRPSTTGTSRWDGCTWTRRHRYASPASWGTSALSGCPRRSRPCRTRFPTYASSPGTSAGARVSWKPTWPNGCSCPPTPRRRRRSPPARAGCGTGCGTPNGARDEEWPRGRAARCADRGAAAARTHHAARRLRTHQRGDSGGARHPRRRRRVRGQPAGGRDPRRRTGR